MCKSLSEECFDVENRYKNTSRWLKAPNGKNSNLIERECIYVRTSTFKRWFGDWENIYKIKKVLYLKPYDITNDSTKTENAKDVYKSIGKVVNEETGMIVDFVNSAFGKIIRHNGYDPRFIGKLKFLFVKSVLMLEEKPDFDTPRADGTIHKDQSSNVIGFTHFINSFIMNGKKFAVRYTVRNHRTKRVGVNNQFHSQYVSEIKLSSLPTETALFVRGAEFAASDLKLSLFIKSVNECSKILDDNGEPNTVYLDEIIGDSYIFKECHSESFYKRYFLNIRKPLYLSTYK